MRYYSRFDYEISDITTADKEKIRELEEYFSEPKEGVIGFEKVEVEVNDKGEVIGITPLDFYEKFYDGELFAKKLSECLTSGKIELYFRDDDESLWGYRVSPGKVETIYSLWLTEEELDEYRKWKETKNGYLVCFYDEENVYALIQVSNKVRVDEVKELLNKYREEELTYNIDEFLDILEKNGIEFKRVPLAHNADIDIYF